jgi:YD repeat-containing protein
LIEEDFQSSDPVLDYTDSYLFDLASNRVQKTRDLGRNGIIDETTTAVFDANDRLWSESVDRVFGDSTQTDYDWLGTQQIAKTILTGDPADPASHGSTTAFGYDLQGRLRTATVTQQRGGQATRVETTTYAYNTSGIRVSALTETDADGDGTIDARVRTEFLNDANNPTGYSQVLRESHYDADTDSTDQDHRLHLRARRVDAAHHRDR